MYTRFRLFRLFLRHSNNPITSEEKSRRRVQCSPLLYSVSAQCSATARRSRQKSSRVVQCSPLLCLDVCPPQSALQEGQAEMADAVQGQITFICSLQSVACAWAFVLLFPLSNRKRCASAPLCKWMQCPSHHRLELHYCEDKTHPRSAHIPKSSLG